MRSLLQFIARYSNFLVFLLLEVVAFMLIIFFNSYPRSTAFSTANKVIAWQYETEENLVDYFHLKQVNRQLNEENAELRQRLSELENIRQDSIATAHSAIWKRYSYIPAKAIHATTNQDHNYITIDRGEVDGIRDGMGVINHEGVVGIVCATSEHYSLVIPTIHTKMQVSCRLSKNKYVGTVQWNGTRCNYASLEEIASHIELCKGDTIVTSGLSSSFPENIPIGIVDKVSINDGDLYYTVRVKLFTRFRQLDYVQVIKNTLAEEQKHLENGVD